ARRDPRARDGKRGNHGVSVNQAEQTFTRQLVEHFQVIRRQGDLRILFLGLLLAGSGVSALMALIPVFAVRELRADTADVGVYGTVVMLVSIPVGLIAGRLTDRLADRRLFAVPATLWVTAGFAAVQLVGDFTGLLVVGIAFFTFVDTTNAQLLAYGREAVAGLPGSAQPAIVSTLRTAYSFGYIVGPVVVAGLLALVDTRMGITAFGVLYLLSAVAYVRRRRAASASVPGTPSADTSAPAAPAPRTSHLYWVAAALALVTTAPVVRGSFLLLRATEDLAIPLEHMIAVLAVAPIAELVLMPLCGVAAGRWGTGRLVAVGAAVAVAEMLLLAVADRLWQLALLQLAGAFVIASVVSVGMTLVQDLAGPRIGYGTSVFLATRAAGGVLGASVGGLIGAKAGLGATFLAAAGASALATVVLVVVDACRRGTTRAPAG
ncbi:MAG TPA: MFS transporter, partial [Phytomonospora sp.]